MEELVNIPALLLVSDGVTQFRELSVFLDINVGGKLGWVFGKSGIQISLKVARR